MHRGFVTVSLLAGLTLPPGSARAIESSISFIHADAVHAQGITGRGVTVAVIGSGVDYGAGGLLGDIALGGVSWVNGTQINDRGANPYGDTHDTLVSLIITDPCGVAPDAKILPIRISDSTGGWDNADLVEVIKYAAARAKWDPTIHVINLSQGTNDLYMCMCDNDNGDIREMQRAIAEAAANGVVTIACTGNELNCGMICAPACVAQVVPVAAVYDDYYFIVDDPDCIDIAVPSLPTCWSNISSGCDPHLLGAPGYDISIGPFQHEEGTSFAVPHVAGVAALMFEKNGCGSLPAWQVRQILSTTATPCPPRLGCGLDAPKQVNALAAVNAVTNIPCVSLGDLDGDTTISFADFLWLEECMSGPSVGPVQGFCSGADFGHPSPDGYIDLRDFAAFQLAFTGYGTGACCCNLHGECRITTPKECDENEEHWGTYQGHNTTCEEVQCDPGDWGACWFWPAGPENPPTCEEKTRDNCIWGDTWFGDEGFYLGDGSRCASSACPTPRYRNISEDPDHMTYTACGDGLELADDITLSPGDAAGLVYYDLAVYGGGVGFFDVTVGLYTHCPGQGGTLIPGTEQTFADNPDYGGPVFLITTFDPPVYVPDHFWMVVRFSDPACGWFRTQQAQIGFTEDIFARNDGGDPPTWVCNYWWHDPNDPNDPNAPYAGYWANIGCITAVGACCYADVTCTEGTYAECAAAYGVYYGHGTSCATTACIWIDGTACCDPQTGNCTRLPPEVCNEWGLVWMGPGSSCISTICQWGRYSNENAWGGGSFVAPGASMSVGDDMTLAGAGARELVYYDLLVYGGDGGVFTVTTSLFTACPGEGGATLIEGTEFAWGNVPDDGQPHLLAVDLADSPVTIPDTVWMIATFSTDTSGWIYAGEAEIGYTSRVYARDGPPWGCNFGCPVLWYGLWANLFTKVGGGGRSGGGTPILTITPMPVEVPPVRIESGRASGAGRPAASGPFTTTTPGEKRLDARRACTVREGLGKGTGPRGGAKGRSPATVTLKLTSDKASQRVQPGDQVHWTVWASVSPGDNAGLALVGVDLEQDAGNPQLFELPPAEIRGPYMEYFDRPLGIANPWPTGDWTGFFGTPIGPAGATNLIQIGAAQNTFGEPGDTMGLNVYVNPGLGQSGAQEIVTGTFAAPATPGTYVFRITNGFANVLNSMDPPPEPPAFWPASAADVVLEPPAFSFAIGDAVPCTVGDLNYDSVLDGADIQPFTGVFLDPDAASAQQFCAADIDNDLDVDAADVPLFAGLLLGAGSIVLLDDCNGNGVSDAVDIAGGISQECNQNFIPDECDIDPADPDGDGVISNDLNENGIPDECEPDCNGNGVPDDKDIADQTSNDVNSNGIPDECELDCNQNGIPDAWEIAQQIAADCNGNGIPDDCEFDCNGNQVPDDCDIASGWSLDCNGNEYPDECDVAMEPPFGSLDCNGNEIPDECDITSGLSLDENENGIPDECE